MGERHLSPVYIFGDIMLTRTHFENIALILARNNACDALINDFVDYLSKQNSKFDRWRFKERIKELKLSYCYNVR